VCANSHLQQLETAGPAPHRDFIKMIVGYALTCKMRLPGVSDTIQEARYQARKNGRSVITATDIRSALLDYRIPSDEALQQAFEPVARRSNGGAAMSPSTPNLSFKSILQRRCTPFA
jgi:LonB protease-like protein